MGFDIVVFTFYASLVPVGCKLSNWNAQRNALVALGAVWPMNTIACAPESDFDQAAIKLRGQYNTRVGNMVMRGVSRQVWARSWRTLVQA